MTKYFKNFEKIYIEESAQKSALAQRAFKFFPHKKIQIIPEDFFEKGTLSAQQIEESKKNLLLKEFKGSFFKRCPGAKKRLMCCNYFVLNLGQHCEMDCSYCYLQSFINFPAVIIYSNIEKALEELEGIKKTHSKDYLRIGTGEQTDSLSLDDLSLYSASLVEFFRSCPHWVLEFKTKSDNTKNFENISHAGNVTVSWSINPEYVVDREEKGTATLKARLKAARRVKDKGFKLSFHIDPLIFFPEWKSHYKDLLDQITRIFKAEELTHISLGALRFQPSQKQLMRQRFKMQSLVCRGEFFKASDGKLRYDQALRTEMFTYLHSLLKKRGFACFLCMETPEVWLEALHQPAKKIPNIQKDFDLRLTQKITQSQLKSSFIHR